MPTATTSLRPDMSRTRPAWRMPAPRDVVVKGERMRYFEQGRSGFFHDVVAKEVEAMMLIEPQYDNDRTREAIVRDSGLARAELDDAAMAQVRVATLLIWGDRDALIPLERGQAAARAIPGARLVVLRDIGHIPSVECPAEFARLVDEFASQ